MTIKPYLQYNGQCEQALTTYAEALGGDFQVVAYQENGSSVYHSDFKIGGEVVFMAADRMDEEATLPSLSVSVSVDFTDPTSQKKAFKKLSEGGEVSLPLGPTHFGAHMGVVRDTYGINWILHHEPK